MRSGAGAGRCADGSERRWERPAIGPDAVVASDATRAFRKYLATYQENRIHALVRLKPAVDAQIRTTPARKILYTQGTAIGCRRHVAGDTPTIFLKPRLNAASESYPTSRAIAATFVDPSESSLAASCIRQCAR